MLLVTHTSSATNGVWEEEKGGGRSVCEGQLGAEGEEGGWAEGVKGGTEEKCACERVCMKGARSQ